MRTRIGIGLAALLGIVALGWAHAQPAPEDDEWKQRVGLLHELRALQGVARDQEVIEELIGRLGAADRERLRREIEVLHGLARHGEPRGERGPRRGGGREQLERRVHHLHVAAENLAAAGEERRAEEVRRHAEELMEQARRRRVGPDGEAVRHHVEELTGIVEELRREVHALREIVVDLERRVGRLSRERDRR